MSLRLHFAAAVVAATGALALSSAAQAAVFQRDVTVALNPIQIAGSDWNSGFLTLPAPVTIRAGDTIQVNVAFADGKALRWADLGAPLEGAIFGVIPGFNGPLNTTAFHVRSFSFDGARGDLAASTISGPSSSLGFGIVGNTFNEGVDDLTGSSFSFTGYHFAFNVTSMTQSSIVFERTLSSFTGGNFSVVQAPAAVPEPGQLLFVGAGLAALAATAVRRTRRPTAQR